MRVPLVFLSEQWDRSGPGRRPDARHPTREPVVHEHRRRCSPVGLRRGREGNPDDRDPRQRLHAAGVWTGAPARSGSSSPPEHVGHGPGEGPTTGVIGRVVMPRVVLRVLGSFTPGGGCLRDDEPDGLPTLQAGDRHHVVRVPNDDLRAVSEAQPVSAVRDADVVRSAVFICQHGRVCPLECSRDELGAEHDGRDRRAGLTTSEHDERSRRRRTSRRRMLTAPATGEECQRHRRDDKDDEKRRDNDNAAVVARRSHRTVAAPVVSRRSGSGAPACRSSRTRATIIAFIKIQSAPRKSCTRSASRGLTLMTSGYGYADDGPSAHTRRGSAGIPMPARRARSRTPFAFRVWGLLPAGAQVVSRAGLFPIVTGGSPDDSCSQ